MKRSQNITILFVVLTLTGAAVLSVYIFGKQTICNEIIVSFNDAPDGKYIETSTLLEILHEEYGEIIGMPLNKISVASIKQIVESLPQVKHANVYKNAKGSLHIETDERIPLFRIITDNGKSMYADTEGFLMPVSKKTPARVIVANGNIQVPDSADQKEMPINKLPQIQKIYDLISHINSDDFLSAQIQQVYINKKQEILLIPRVGNHDILLGDFDDFEKKLFRLRYFYFNIIADKGWNTYKRLNLSFKNQIVAEK